MLWCKNELKQLIILSLLLIDKSEDCDYFIYKYNLSNKEKDKIILLNSIFSSEPNKDFFAKENLLKILLKNGKENLIDILDFKILISKKNKDILIELKKYLSRTTCTRDQGYIFLLIQ